MTATVLSLHLGAAPAADLLPVVLLLVAAVAAVAVAVMAAAIPLLLLLLLLLRLATLPALAALLLVQVAALVALAALQAKVAMLLAKAAPLTHLLGSGGAALRRAQVAAPAQAARPLVAKAALGPDLSPETFPLTPGLLVKQRA